MDRLSEKRLLSAARAMTREELKRAADRLRRLHRDMAVGFDNAFEEVMDGLDELLASAPPAAPRGPVNAVKILVAAAEAQTDPARARVLLQAADVIRARGWSTEGRIDWGRAPGRTP